MKKLYVDGTEFDTIDEAVAEVLDYVDEDAFEENICEEYDDYTYVEVCGETYDIATCELLKLLNAYDDLYDEWTEKQREIIKDEIEGLDIGDKKTIYGCEVEVKDDIVELFANAREACKELGTILESLPSLYVDKRETTLRGANDLNVLIEFIDAVEEMVTREA